MTITAPETRPGHNGPDVTITPLTPPVGATMDGLDLSAPDDATARIIRRALARHLVVFVTGQDLTPRQLRDFTAQFGPVFSHHSDEGVIKDAAVPEVLEMRKEPDGTRLFGGTAWHADVTFRKPGALYSVLHARVLPPVGGDTGFASTVASFAALTPAMQDMLRGLKAVHSYDGPGRPDREGQTAIHPVVRTHPDSGAEGLYFNRMFGVRFEGMTEYESKPLIDFLDHHMTRPEFTCRLRWQPGMVAIWDNRFTLHYPINDFTGHLRSLIRCTAMDT
ncbi:MAG: TauD/TfdA family dioxygenase [Alphaproteobacteria bacterium]